MKILWVCNIMLPVVAEHLGMEGSNKEGWLSGLCNVILMRQRENGIELHVAFPVDKKMDGYAEEISTKAGILHCHGFYEDIKNAERYDETLENRLRHIIDRVQPDVIHCFGTEYAHTLATVKCAPDPSRVLVGIQGVCGVIAEAYMANLPEKVQKSVTFRDWIKSDSMRKQQRKFQIRGMREQETLQKAVNVTGRTEFDQSYAEAYNPKVRYFSMNETLRPCFYEGEWRLEHCEPHSIFLSQGDYPLKGLHYLLIAAAKLRKAYPDLQISIAGNSLVNYQSLKDKIKISAYGKYLRSLIQKYDLEECVHFLGKMTALQMKEQYLKSNVFVCCSSNENSPNSLGEAMILGVPCVAARVGGIPSLFEHEKDGILFDGYETAGREENNACNPKESPEKDPLYLVADSLYKGIVRIWKNKDETYEYCKNARFHARKIHDREENYRKMMEIYATIANENVSQSDCGE